MSVIPIHDSSALPEETADFYRAGARALMKAGVPFLVGGAYAMGRCTRIERHTKDFDIFVKSTDAKRALEVLKNEGYHTEFPFPHWLGKAYSGDDFIDVIFSSGNGIAVVDDEWFQHAVTGKVLGMEMQICAVEEIIWSKSFIQERERFDGADVAHLIRECAESMDWERLMRRYGDRWRVLFTHLVMFGFIYPGDRDRLPKELMTSLTARLQEEIDSPAPDTKICQGTLLSRQQYLIDIEKFGYEDARREANVRMSDTQIRIWTDAIGKEQH
jgi:hypothetical protein